MKILNDNIGNFIHRTLTFIEKQFDSKVPEKIEYDATDKKFLEKLNSVSIGVGESLIKFKIRKAIRDIVNFAKEGNIFLNNKAPWHLIKNDKKAAGHVFNICAQAVYLIAVLLGPFIPETSEKILSYLNAPKLADIEWDSIAENSVKAGQTIKKPKPLFQKLEIEEIKNQYKKLKEEKPKEGDKELISYDDFQKLDIRVALVEKVEKVPKADKLYKLSIDLGTEKRTIVAGLAEFYKAKELEGKKIIVLTNLEPRKLRGITSEGMLLAADFEDKVSILIPDKDIPIGATIR
jgi:methionyl-tRNA synthetase